MNPPQDPWLWHLPLADDTEVLGPDDVTVSVARRGRLDAIGGRRAWHPTDPDATLTLPMDGWTDGEAGTVSAWFCPREPIGPRQATQDPDRGRRDSSFPIVADTYPPERAQGDDADVYSRFARGQATLALVAWPRATAALEGRVFHGHSGYLPGDVGGPRAQVAPADTAEEERPRARVISSEPRFERGQWYHVALGWDRDAARIELYLNGELVNAADGYVFDEPGDTLYFGNPFIALADVSGSDRLVGPDAVAAAYEAATADDRRVDDVSAAIRGTESTPFDVDLSDFELQTDLPLTAPAEVDQFTQFGPDSMPLAALRATPEGMLFETRDTWDVENLCTLWGPDQYEGDLHLECDVRVERENGLALIAFDATTFQRGDVLAHRDFERTGSMKTHLFQLRNYWWEWLRLTPVVRTDRRDHVIAKGPHLAPVLDHNLADVPGVDQWHTLTIRREGERVRCAIDDRCLLDARDPPFTGTGPPYNVGRIAIRHMQKTRIRYRNLRVWTRPQS